MCLVFIMDLKVQLDSASLELIKCQIILENNTAKNIKIKTLHGQLYNLIKVWKPQMLQPLDYLKKISEKEVIWDVTDNELISMNREITSKSQENLTFEIVLPKNWLPTFRGKTLQLTSKLKLELIAYQGKIQKFLINIPIEPMQPLMKTIENNSSGALHKTNPFLSDLHLKPKVFLVQELCTPFLGRISDANGEIAKVFIQKRHFQVGDPIIGTIDFRETPKLTRICAKCVVSVVTTETWKNPDSDMSTVQATFQDICYGTDFVSFSLDIPQNSTPTFSTDFCKFSSLLQLVKFVILVWIFIVDLKWSLKMEFYLTNDMQMQVTQEDWKAPKNIQVKNLIWQTPLYVYKQ